MKFEFISRNSESTFEGADCTFSKFSVEINGEQFKFAHIAGRAPTFDEFCSGVLETLFSDVAIGDFAIMPEFARRVNPYRIVARVGYSGCEDYILEEARNNSVVRHSVLHISMFGKMNWDIRDAYLDDVLQTLVALNRLDSAGYGAGKKYAPCYETKSWFKQLEKYTPRNIVEEPGWRTPNGDVLNEDLEGNYTIQKIWERSGGNRVDSITEGWFGKIIEEYWEWVQEAEVDAVCN